ncbi:hypothetical protein [Paractinoplanes brasiliensis]|nr:hypothetical protein [Actinoplanes brasiliensis]
MRAFSPRRGLEALDPEDSFHPNTRGYQAVSDRLRSALGLP